MAKLQLQSGPSEYEHIFYQETDDTHEFQIFFTKQMLALLRNIS